MALKFGTDGIRGVANTELSIELSLALGRATVRVLGHDHFLLARDTRESGVLLGSALALGMTQCGATVTDLGVLPTAGLAYFSKSQQLPAAMISASHNPYEDNGIKLFLVGGEKLTDDVEERLEQALGEELSNAADLLKPASDQVEVGSIVQAAHDWAWADYGQHVRDAMTGEDLDGVRVVIDAANGAASAGVESIFNSLGADVTVINNQPDGKNINRDCGSTYPQQLQREVVERGAQIGLALDGDADRVIAVDENGNLVDGDQMMCIFAGPMNDSGQLANNEIAVTVMSNFGLHAYLKNVGIGVRTTPVGDRYVLEALKEHQLSLGGEQSGHIVIPRFGATGDGIVTGALLVSYVKRFGGGSLSKLCSSVMTRFPQVLKNVRVKDRAKLETAQEVWSAVRRAEENLGSEGRVLLRPSGTEPVVRVMVEAKTQQIADQICDELCAVVTEYV